MHGVVEVVVAPHGQIMVLVGKDCNFFFKVASNMKEEGRPGGLGTNWMGDLVVVALEGRVGMEVLFGGGKSSLVLLGQSL